jgi:endogenous inhibitor of DNA gyrase (YacG/DUF329 family)
MPTVECPYCAAKSNVPAGYDGRTTECVNCGKPVLINSRRTTKRPLLQPRRLLLAGPPSSPGPPLRLSRSCAGS